MSLFPDWFRTRDRVVFALNLVSLDTPDGVFGYMLGVDGVFTDITGRKWIGSQLVEPGDDEFAMGGNAPSGSFTLSFFQDPEAPDVVAQVRALGADYVNGRPLTQFIQPLRDAGDFQAPITPPVQVMVRTMRKIRTSMDGAQGRAITVTYESAFETRRRARRLTWNVEDHARLIGEPDPSLQYAPQQYDHEEKLF